jgi:hypothetical protein
MTFQPNDPNCECALCDQTLHPDDHVMRLGDNEWHTVRELRAAAAKEFEPPKAYERDVRQMRAASATDLSRFEVDYKASRLRELAAEYAEIDAHLEANPSPRLTAAELAEYAPPDPYEAGIKALRAKATR